MERNPGKTFEEMLAHFQPSIVWLAYTSLDLINDHKFNVVDRDDDDERVKTSTKSRTQQREESRASKIAKKTHNNVEYTMFIQHRQQHNAEQLILQKARELQKGQSADLFKRSLAILNAAKDGALDVLSAEIKESLLRKAGESTWSALQSMEEMVQNPCTYIYANSVDNDNTQVHEPTLFNTSEKDLSDESESEG